MAKGIVEKHAGAISVRSVEGQGTTFSVTLPVRVSGPVVAEDGAPE